MLKTRKRPRSRATLEDYMKSISLIKKMSAKPIGSETPIKITQFCDDHGVGDNLFTILTKIGAIEPVIGEKREGTIFSWIYKKAENEPESGLASKVMDFRSQLGKDYYTNYVKKGKTVSGESPKKIKKFTTQGLTIKAGSDGVSIKTTGKEAHTEEVIDTSREYLVHEIEAAPAPETEAAPAPEREYAPITQKRTRSVDFTMEGVFSKADLFKKLEALIDDQEISSISLAVKY